jgi:hypothetical protein
MLILDSQKFNAALNHRILPYAPQHALAAGVSGGCLKQPPSL